MGGRPAPHAIAADLEATIEALLPVARRQRFFRHFANAKLWVGQRGIVMPLHYDATDNLYVMAWGRKRAILAEPGQMGALYRFPNSHPHAGSSQVNLSAPNLTRHPRFAQARFREAIVGPGDTLYLPGMWWHQFEQPFEDTGALNLWSDEGDPVTGGAVPGWERDGRLLEHSLHDHLESSASRHLGNRVGIVLSALARGQKSARKSSSAARSTDELARANETLHRAADEWKGWARNVASDREPARVEDLVRRPTTELVRDFLELGFQDVVVGERWARWKPGVEWNLSSVAPLHPHGLQHRCRPTPAAMRATFASICDGSAP